MAERVIQQPGTTHEWPLQPSFDCGERLGGLTMTTQCPWIRDPRDH